MITIVPAATSTTATVAGMTAAAATPLLPVVGLVCLGLWLLSEREPDALDEILDKV